MGCCSSKNAVVTPLEKKPPSRKTSTKKPELGKKKTKTPIEHVANDEICNVFDIEECPKHYPQPVPPSSNKDRYLNDKDFAEIDKFAKQAPREVLDDYARLVEYFKQPVSDLDKVRAILRWLIRVRRLGLLREAGPGHDEDNYSIGGSSMKQIGVETNQTVVTKQIVNQESVRQIVSNDSEVGIGNDLDLRNQRESGVKEDNLVADDDSDHEASIHNDEVVDNQSHLQMDYQSQMGVNDQSNLVNVRQIESQEHSRASIRNEDNNESDLAQSQMGVNNQSNLEVNVRQIESQEHSRASIRNEDNNGSELAQDQHQGESDAFSNKEVNEHDQASNVHSNQDVVSQSTRDEENGPFYGPQEYAVPVPNVHSNQDVVSQSTRDEENGPFYGPQEYAVPAPEDGPQDPDADGNHGIYSESNDHLDKNSNRFESFKKRGNRHTPKGDLQLVHEKKVDITILFAVICRKAQIKCSIIPGRIKTHHYEVGGMIETGKWNGVFLDGEWRLIHPHWCGFRFPLMATRKEDNIDIENSKRNHQFDDHFFLTDPAQFVTRCIPDDDKWQLLDKPVPFEKFKLMPHVTEEFHKLGLWMPNEQEGIVKTNNGKACLKIEFPIKHQPQLYYYINEKEVETDGSGSSLEMDPTLIRRCVYMYKKERFYYLRLRFNKRGKYILKIHGRLLTAIDSEHDEAPLLCQFEIVCNEPDEQWRPLPISPAIGWGQSGVATSMGVILVSHKHGIVPLNEHGRVNIMFKLICDLELKAELFDCVNQERRAIPKFHFKKDKAVLNIVLPPKGEKYLRIFAKTAETGQFVNVHNFILKPQMIFTEKERARDRRLKNNLEKAMKSGSEHELRRAIRDYEMFIHTDTGELDKVEERLAFLAIKRRLFEALQREYIPLMKVAIYDAEHSKYSKKLQSQVRVLKAHLEKLQQSAPYHVLPLNQSLMIEIRGYMKPSSIIYDVMVAALLLLGERWRDLEEWDYVRGLMGRESILRRMETFNPGSVDEERLDEIRLDKKRLDKKRLDEVEELWSRYTLQQVWEASAGAAVIHKWTGKAIDKIRGRESKEQIQHTGNGSVKHSTRDETPATPLSSRMSRDRKSPGGRKRKASTSLEDESEDEPTTTRDVSFEVDNLERKNSLERIDKRLKSDGNSGQLGNDSMM